MINILKFREFVATLVARINKETPYTISNSVLAVREEHMVKKLKGKEGICLAVNFPDASCEGRQDNSPDDSLAVFFILEKMAPGGLSEEDEILRYNDLQNAMLHLREFLRQASHSLDCIGIEVPEKFKIEWEYQVFGTFNGLSISVNIRDYDGAVH